MKAVRLHRKGGPDALVYEYAPRPNLLEQDALVRVRAVAITGPELSWGTTYVASDGAPRLPSIPGHEISGVVEALGASTDGFHAGSAVFGLTDFYRDGGEAEFVAVRARDLALKPRSLDFVHAAAVPLSGLTAWQALFDHGRLAAGQRVLIHGAAGGVGTFAVQLAAWRGAHVIGTASANNDRFLRELGADEVIDYTARRFEDIVHDVDLVLDAIGGNTLDRSWGVLRKGGTVRRSQPLLHRRAQPSAADGAGTIDRCRSTPSGCGGSLSAGAGANGIRKKPSRPQPRQDRPARAGEWMRAAVRAEASE
jgi:NADPH:quinone reductase-like Zn-dependent oxidoreductase